MLDRLLRDDRVTVAALVTTLDESSQCISAHGVRLEMIERQAAALGLSLSTVALPPNPSNEIYLERFAQTLAPLQESGVDAIAFGDIFLEDLRRWREGSFGPMGLATIFPLWGDSSYALADEFVARGFSAVLCCVNGAYLDQTYLGRLYDTRLFERLPHNVDRCGENGEFHSFTFDGPIFREPVRYAAGEISYKPVMHGSPVTGHWFCDLRPLTTSQDRCPLCGGDNTCAVAAGEHGCWCFSESIAAEVLERVPPYARDVACVCRRCVQSHSLSGSRS